MLPLALLLAMDEPPPTELASVSFAPDGKHALVETRWVLDGPGFPVARVEVFDLTTGKHALDKQVELREETASAGLVGATSAARSLFASQLAGYGLPGAAATASGCADGECGGGAGCATGTDVVVTSAPATGETCPEAWKGEVPTVTVAGRLLSLDTPRIPCARHFVPDRLYSNGAAGVLILAYEMPGHEGPAPRFYALAGSLR